MNSALKTGAREFPQPFASSVSPLRLLALLAIYFALWLVLTPYGGLTHDAQAYAFQALAQLHPGIFAQDIFLKYQTQHHYSVFPQIYAALIPPYGLEAPATVLTFGFHVLWYGAAYLIARRLFGARLALLCLGLLVTIPGPYGGQRVFSIAEPFLTPRLPTEAISLLAIWAYLQGWRLAAALLCAAGLVLHPLMAFPAILLIAFTWTDQARPMRVTVPIAAAVVVAGAIVGSFVLGGRMSTMSADWVQALRGRSGYLFLDSWSPEDWNHTLTSIATLAIASRAIDDGLGRSVARAALWLGLTGLLLAAFVTEIWNLDILMQGQPWRWLWLARFFAIACLPAALYATWPSGPAGRAVALLLAAGWLVVVPVSAHSLAPWIMGSLLASLALAIWSTRNMLSVPAQILFLRGAWAVMALVLVAAAITVSLSAMVVRADLQMPSYSARLITTLRPIAPAILIATCAWAALLVGRSKLVTGLMLIVAVALLSMAIPASAERWTRRPYSEEQHELYSDWRSVIPPDAEVFWWDSLREVWFLLDRRSYLTLSQGGGLVFSAEASAEFRRRAENVRDFIDPGYWFNELHAINAQPYPLTGEILNQVCRDPALGFVVSADNLRGAVARKEWPAAGKYVYLYDCSDFRPSHSS